MDCSFVECAIGSTCFEVGPTPDLPSICLQNCDTSAVCREGYVCTQIDGLGACYPRCSSNSDCPQGMTCAAATGECG